MLYPWFSTTQLDFIVEVTVRHFEQDTTGAARLVCVWTIKDGASGERIDGGQFERNEPTESAATGASVAAQSRLLSQLGREIAAAILGASR